MRFDAAFGSRPAAGTGAERPTMISYAQNGEDVVLERVFRDREQGFYVDVGASDPVDDSVTFHFYERGWRGVNVEPDPHDFERLAAARDRDVNLEAAVGSGAGPADFYPSAVRGLGTVDVALARRRGQAEALRVAQIPLSRIFAEHAPDEGVDFLKIDAEGAEADVLASADWEHDRPRVIVVEAVDVAGEPAHGSWEPLLLEHGYSFVLFDGLNRFYCRDEDVDHDGPILAAPPNVFDNWLRIREAEALAEARRSVETRKALSAEQQAHAKARRELADVRAALEAEQSAYDQACAELLSVYDSTSWRLTAPVRDASRLARLLRPGGVS